MNILIPLFVFGLLGGAIVAALVRSARQDERRWLLHTLLAAFFLRMAAATVFGLFPSTRVFHDDADGYEEIGLLMAANWSNEGPPFPMRLSLNYGFYYINAAVYYVFGRFRVNASYLNAILGTVSIALVYSLARRFFHNLVARRTALLAAFMPSMILWNSVAMKDTLMTFLIVACMYACVRLKERLTLTAVVVVVLSIAAMQPIRFYMVYFVGFAVLSSLLLDRGLRVVSGVYKQIFIAAILLLFFAMVGLSSNAQESAQFLSLERTSRFRQGMAISAESGYGVGIDTSTPAGALLFLPLGLTVMLLGPFPWQMTSLRSLMAAPETILWWFLFPSLLRGIRTVLKQRFAELSPLLIFSATLSVGYALSHGNVGAAFRQRTQIFVFLFIFVALGWYQKKCRQAGLDERLLLNSKPRG
jgi:4-amino-4-deoxy-L-arabinose transferase-like glycosyltransferase